VNSFGYGGSNAHVVIEDAQGYLESHGTPSNTYKVLRNGSLPSLESHRNGSYGGAQSTNGSTNEHQRNTNGLKDHQPTDEVEASDPRLLTVSAFDESSCKEQINRLRDYCNNHDKGRFNNSLDNLAFTLNERRSRFAWKAAVYGDSLVDLADALTKAKPVRTGKKPIVGFVFTGQGAQWCGMSRELLDAYPVFTNTIDQIDRYLISLGAPFSVRGEQTICI
jgi:acyl transferase domain-containing protein